MLKQQISQELNQKLWGYQISYNDEIRLLKIWG